MPRYPLPTFTAEGLSHNVYGQLPAKPRSVQGPVFALNVGDTYLEPMKGARAEDQKAADHVRLHNYAPVQGEPVLLEAIVNKVRRRTGVTLDRECLQAMAGATGGLAIVCSVLLDPGDEVLLPSPFWPLIRGMIKSRGCRAVEIPFYTNLSRPDFDPIAALEAAVTPKTAAMYINSPHNPTGNVLKDELVAELARFAKRHDLWVITDEVYEDVWYGDHPPGNLWNQPNMQERTVANHSLSKSYAMAGARVGYAHGPYQVMQAIRGVQTFLTYCAPRPLQMAAAYALEHGDDWLKEMRATYKPAAQMASQALGLPMPAGSTFLFFDASPYLKPKEQLSDFLQRCLDAGVMLTPGGASGDHYASWARLCFTAVPPDDLEQALGRLKTALDASAD